MTQPLLERRSPVGLTYALLILTVFFFFVPSAFRAARLSLGQKENNVKDWLPSDFPETSELKWFEKHFAGESFVVATWPGCTSGDKRLKLLEQKLVHESAEHDPSVGMSEEVRKQYKKARKFGIELSLLASGDEHDNWGGLNEKWLGTPSGQWYYITPNGHLYRWEELSNGPAVLIRSAKRSSGKHKLEGTFVTAFGSTPTGDETNPFYNDPSLFCAPLFQSVQTGDSIALELSKEDGALWPIDLTEEDRRPIVAKRAAMDRLTGTLFAPAVKDDFEWSPKGFRDAIPEERRDELPKDFDTLVTESLQRTADYYYDGSVEKIAQADSQAKSDAFYAVYDAAKVEPPARSTCVFVTLTDLAKENLAFAIGRGAVGAPRGRLLQLAAESGVQPASPPSMAPPPFNKKEVESIAGTPPLRMGGPPVDNVAIDEEGTITLVRLVGYSVLVGVILSYIVFASFKITLMVFIVGGTAAMLSMSCVWWTNGRVDAILMSMPSLVYVLGLSGAIHVINYYRDEVRARGQSGAAGRALKHAFLPCTLASVTTAIGLISLYSSNLAPISNFGLYSAIGVIATLAILFSYLPASLETFAPRLDPDTESTPDPTEESWLSDAWAAVGRWITGHHVAVATVTMLILIVASVGLAKIKTSVQLLKLFDPDSRIIHDYAWMEENFGKLVPMELIVRVPPSMQAELERDESANKTDQQGLSDEEIVIRNQSLGLLKRAEAVARVETVVRRTLGEPGLGEVGQAMSAGTFMAPLPGANNGWDPLRALFNKKLNEGRDELLGSDYLRMEQDGPYQGSELWRISLRVAALSDTDYGYFISTLRTAVEPVLRAYDTRDHLIKLLSKDASGTTSKLSGKQRVVVIGGERPESLDTVQMVRTGDLADRDAGDQSVDENLINTQAIYASSLSDILASESVSLGWVSREAIEKKMEIGSDLWHKYIGDKDAVIWLGGDGLKATDFAKAKRFVDASTIRDKAISASVLEGNVPDVVGSGHLQAIYTGVIPVVYKAQRTLLSSLVNSIAMAFVLIALVMIVLLNPGRFPLSMLRPGNAIDGLAAGSVSMIPNVFPVLLVFGLMGHRGDLVDIGTMMTASVAMGVAVDDTIHFLSWFRSYLDKGLDRVDAVIETYRRVGPAMTQTTIVGGLGLFVFALSTFTPTQRFGTLMLVLLAAALIGDLILLPALLAGPLGKCFKRREASFDAPDDDDVVDPPASEKEGVDLSDEEDVKHLKVHFPDPHAKRKNRASG